MNQLTLGLTTNLWHLINKFAVSDFCCRCQYSGQYYSNVLHFKHMMYGMLWFYNSFNNWKHMTVAQYWWAIKQKLPLGWQFDRIPPKTTYRWLINQAHGNSCRNGRALMKYLHSIRSFVGTLVRLICLYFSRWMTFTFHIFMCCRLICFQSVPLCVLFVRHHMRPCTLIEFSWLFISFWVAYFWQICLLKYSEKNFYHQKGFI